MKKLFAIVLGLAVAGTLWTGEAYACGCKGGCTGGCGVSSASCGTACQGSCHPAPAPEFCAPPEAPQAGVGCSGGTAPSAARTVSGAVLVNNTICPVMGNEVSSTNPVTYEYEGKVYNFCCPGCIDTFKQDPNRYIARIRRDTGA